MIKIISRLFLFLCLLGQLSCTSEVENEFSNHRAFFRYPQVNTVPQLRTALNSPGEFCKITFPSAHYLFTDSRGKSTLDNRTSLDAYGKPIFIAGFLVGTPSLPDLSGNFYQIAFDLVCPNCFFDTAIQRSLDFKSPLEMQCGRCGRIYDLNNNGIVKGGEKGRPLYRYRMTYGQAQNILVIQN